MCIDSSLPALFVHIVISNEVGIEVVDRVGSYEISFK